MPSRPARQLEFGRDSEPIDLGVRAARSGIGDNQLRFIDLFAGIGGFRFGLEAVGARCVFTSERDRFAQITYEKWHGDEPDGDITTIEPADIPDHEILCAGFPCQPFSLAGVSKKASLGRAHGFLDQTQGTLFFRIAEIVEEKRPPVLFLENVKNLLSHDRGKTWTVIEGTLRSLGYEVFHKVIDAAGWVPQHRERIFIVAFDLQVFGDAPEFEFPDPPADRVHANVESLLDDDVDPKYTLSDRLWDYLQRYRDTHAAKGNGFGFGLADLDGVSRTLSARYHKDGSEILIPQAGGSNPRRLTPDEAKRLMGYPDHLQFPVSDTQAYRQLGNSVSPPVVEAIARQLTAAINRSGADLNPLDDAVGAA